MEKVVSNSFGRKWGKKRRSYGWFLRGLGLVLFATAWPLFICGVAAAIAGFTAGGDPWWSVISVLSALVGFSLLQLGPQLMTWGRKLLSPLGTEVLGRDPRAPVLYFRPFDEDLNVPVRETGFFSYQGTSEEEFLTNVLNKVGPVICIGDPREDLPTLGAARFYVRDE